MVGAIEESAGEPDSYWSNIDYPEPRPRPVVLPAPASRGRGATARIGLGAILAALLIGAGAFAVGRANGQAPVAGLHRRIDTQQQRLRSRAATIAAQGRRLASDEAELQSLRSQDFPLANTLTDRFGSELDEYAGARTTCLGSPTSI
jgi:hypothetical protein